MKRFADLSMPVRCFALVLALVFLGGPSALMAGDLTIALSHAGEQLGELPIGVDLNVSLYGGQMGETYTVRLIDESDQSVASTTLEITYPSGSSPRANLWTSTGVVGCGRCSFPDPTEYRFVSFNEAEAVLNGRTFTIEAISHSSDTVEATTTVDFVADESKIEAFPSDDTGCYRTELIKEDLYVSIRHTLGEVQIFRVFVVPAQPYWSSGDALLDVRPNGSQTVTVPSGPNPVVEPMWLNPWAGEQEHPFDYYQLIIRPSADANPAFDPTKDLVANPVHIPSGITFEECIVCIPPSSN